MNKLRSVLRMAYRRWRCDHFDHPFKQVYEYDNNSGADISSFVSRDKHYRCNYCHRVFSIPLTHPRCRCTYEPIIIDDEKTA